MYSLAYKFEQVFSVAYFDAVSYEGAVLIASHMRASEGVGAIEVDTTKHINVNDDVLWLYYIYIAGYRFEVFARDDQEAFLRGDALKQSTKPVIRINSAFV